MIKGKKKPPKCEMSVMLFCNVIFWWSVMMKYNLLLCQVLPIYGTFYVSVSYRSVTVYGLVMGYAACIRAQIQMFPRLRMTQSCCHLTAVQGPGKQWLVFLRQPFVSRCLHHSRCSLCLSRSQQEEAKIHKRHLWPYLMVNEVKVK